MVLIVRSKGWDHPRVCGEQSIGVNNGEKILGSPPRVRGTEPLLNAQMISAGITPACAGNSLTPVFAGETTTDHPRVCGEQRLIF